MFSAFNTFGRLGASASAAPFSPTKLFAAGEAGGVWDFTTLANLYQDSAGTTPCTAMGQTIGLVLDTKNGTPQLGPELITDAGWVAYAGTNVAVSAGVVTVTDNTGATGYQRAYQDVSTVAGKSYRITARLVSTTDARNVSGINVWNGSFGSIIYRSNNAIPGGLLSRVFVAEGTTSRVDLVEVDPPNTTPKQWVWDSLSVKELPGNHASQATSTKRPLLGRMPAGGVRNLLVNTATLSTQNVTTVAGSYTIQFTGAGSVTASGTYSGALTSGQTFTCTAGTLTLTVSGSVTAAQLEAGSTATAKQVVGAAYDVTESGVASVYTAYFDGVDDCLVSPSINFSGTDAMSVFAGFRKTSDAALGMVAELSATTASNNGSFALTAPNAASATIVYESKGTALTDTSATIAAPADSVIAAVSDISADSNVLRRNGAEAESDTGDQGTGNYGNYPLYIGQRGAATLPYKGFLSALCTRGAATDAALVVSMEKWLASKTPGVTLP